MTIHGHKIGIGLRPPHYSQMLDEKPKIDWLEVHQENFMSKGGPLLDILSTLHDTYPISFHGVGLSLGSAQGISKNHLKRIKTLIRHIEPIFISDHLSWSSTGNTFLPDLLPIPYNEESLTIIANNIDEVQNYLQRELLIENPSSYLEYNNSTYSESEFLSQLVQRTNVKILLDINNIYVSCFNHGWSPYQYIQAIPKNAVREIHIAGHTIHKQNEHNHLLLDTHNTFVSQEVWELYSYAIQYIGPVPTLLEWDSDLPDLEVLLNEARKSAAYVYNETNTATFCEKAIRSNQ